MYALFIKNKDDDSPTEGWEFKGFAPDEYVAKEFEEEYEYDIEEGGEEGTVLATKVVEL